MYLDKSGKFVRTDLWREGRWLDFWSVVHFFSGVTIGFLPRYFELNAFAAYTIAFLLLVSYEMFEALAKIEETPQNRTMDVVVGMASFVPAYYLNPLLSVSWSVSLCFFFFLAASVLGFIGWRASKKAAYLEARLRAGIERGRERRRLRKIRRQAVRDLRRAGKRRPFI